MNVAVLAQMPKEYARKSTAELQRYAAEISSCLSNNSPDKVLLDFSILRWPTYTLHLMPTQQVFIPLIN